MSRDEVLARAEAEARKFIEEMDRIDRIRLMGRNPKLILAALTYIYANRDSHQVTQKEVAIYYGVSEAGLCQTIKVMSILTGVKPKTHSYRTLYTLEKITWKKDAVTMRFRNQRSGYQMFITIDMETAKKLAKTLLQGPKEGEADA